MPSIPKIKRIENRALLDEYQLKPCCICGRWPSDPAHIATRGSRAPDKAWNVLPFCRLHHTQQGGWGFLKMMKKYPHLKFILIGMGWEWDTGKMWHPGLRCKNGQ